MISGCWLLALALQGCAGGTNSTADEAEKETQTATSEVAADRTPPALDLAGYPMPADLPGQDRVQGLVRSEPHDPARGASGRLVFATAGDTLLVTVCDLSVNCCTERLAAALTETDGGLDIMLYEYLPDVCECFHQRDVTFGIHPAPLPGHCVIVRMNDRTGLVADGDIP